MSLFRRPSVAPLPMIVIAIALALPWVSGCQDDARTVHRELPAAQPAQAVSRLVEDLRRDDLDAYARHAVPPALHARLDSAWREGRSRWPLTGLPLHARLPGLLTTLAAPDAEKALLSTYERQFAGAGAGRELRSAAATMGLFAGQYLRREGDYSDDERAHYIQLAAALSQWGQRAPLHDARLARMAIPLLVSGARLTGLGGGGADPERVGDASRGERTAGARPPRVGAAADSRATGDARRTPSARTDVPGSEPFGALGMARSLRRLSPFFGRTKRVLVAYGLDLDAALGSVRLETIEQAGDTARVRLRYTIAGRAIDARLALQRIDGQWYLRDVLRHAATQADAPAAASTAVASSTVAPRRVD